MGGASAAVLGPRECLVQGQEGRQEPGYRGYGRQASLGTSEGMAEKTPGQICVLGRLLPNCVEKGFKGEGSRDGLVLVSGYLVLNSDFDIFW